MGSLTDRFFAAQKVLAVLMFAGAILMYFAAQQTEFMYFFLLLLAYSLTYTPTIALTDSIAFGIVCVFPAQYATEKHRQDGC
ncbi:hypothetical protein SOASR015_23950 [Pectobacterium carotovorum subsp. carotovorum]|nr:hypothetical protein SOASR015_23950 [Pectobacterium carotovorum subsp. carotovorum]GLX55206.1 hypothetical protein Pcaca02_05150 [Pectobacterium carotovorum subsp. carotovorum]